LPRTWSLSPTAESAALHLLRGTRLSSRAIATQLGITRYAVLQLQRRHQLRRKLPSGRRLTPAIKTKMAQLIFEARLSARAIARTLGISSNTVNREKRRLGYINPQRRTRRKPARCTEGHLLAIGGTCPICQHEQQLKLKRAQLRNIP
jgi:DNA-binding CsgD family transcriptional regulator